MSHSESIDINGDTVLYGTYSDYRLMHVLESGPQIITLLAAFNLLLLVVDMWMIQDLPAKYIVLSVKVLYSVLLIVFVLNMKNIKSFLTYSRVLTAFELIGVGVFLYIFSQYSNPDFMIQTLGVITIIIVIFLIPNLWGQMIAVVCTIGIGFLLLAGAWIPNLPPMIYAAGIVYITVDSALCAFFSWNRQKLQSREYYAQKELKIKSATDYLTQAVTRFKLEEDAQRYMSLCRRQGMPLSLVFVDVDNLKPINDMYGHLAGDKVLSEIVQRIRAALFEADIVARWGGDEFVLLMPDSDLEKAAEISESIRRSIQNKLFTGGIKATCSFGVAKMKENSTFETMIREADDLMYKSKKLGKNRTEQI
jgi:diguanylate cyclase (GGDEF)-like protein